MSSISVFLLDNSYNTKEEVYMGKPLNYQELFFQIKQQFKNLPNYFEIFCIDKNNKEIKINCEEKYRTIEDILFIREIKQKKNIEQSLFEKNYNKLSESKKEKLDEKYSCLLCLSIIKQENPYFCYKCQKIFHEKCLKDWENKCRMQQNIFSCPTCRNNTPIENWNKKCDYEENRKEMGNLMDEINQLKENKIQQFNIIKKYSKYIEKTFKVFKNILFQINSLHFMLKMTENNNLNNIINSFPLNLDNLELNVISNTINFELEQFKIYLMTVKQSNLNMANPNIKVNAIYNNPIQNQNQNQIRKRNSNNIDNNLYVQYPNFNNNNNKVNSIFKQSLPSYNEIMHKNRNNMSNSSKNLNSNFIGESLKGLDLYKDNINLIYSVSTKGYYTIFGGNFVMNNKFNIKLIINGKQNIDLVSVYELNPGENIITLILKNKLTNLSEMFSGCKILKDIKELEFLDVRNVHNLSGMFNGCSSLVDLNPLLNWNVSNCTNFSLMFCNCTSLSDITPLQFWNVSRGNDFSYMFSKCTNLININALQNWNVANGKDFKSMFSECPKVDLRPIQKWNVHKDYLRYIK